MKTHCKHGHEFSSQNTHIRIRKNGQEERVCISCSNRRAELWTHANPEKRRAAQIKWDHNNPKYCRMKARRYLLKQYGLTEIEYEQMYVTQQGKCAICHQAESSNLGFLAVDHDHTTNKNRALLCRKCNAGIGHLNDDPALVQRAADYLRSFSHAA